MWRPPAHLFVVLLVALLVVVPTAVVVAAPAQAQVVATPSTQAATVAAPSAIRARAGKWLRDFPNLPARCYAAPETGAPRPSACRINRFDRNRPSLVIWGDSHAQQYLPAVRKALQGRNVNLVSFISGGCPPAFVPHRSTAQPNCEAKNRAALDWISDRKQAGQRVSVLLGSSWTRWRQFHRQVRADERAGRAPSFDEAIIRVIELAHTSTTRMFRVLGRFGVRVDVIGNSGVYPTSGKPECPEGEDPYRCTLPRRDVIQDEARTKRFLARNMAKLSGRPRLIDTSNAYCDTALCRGTVNGAPTFYDNVHLSKSLTSTMRRYFLPVARRAAGR